MPRSTFQIAFEAVTGPLERGFQKTATKADRLSDKLDKVENKSLDVREASIKVEQAQIRAAKAADRYGKDSLQAASAQVRLERAQEKASKTAATSATRYARLGDVLKTAGVAATGLAVIGLKKSADAAVEAEKSQARLESQLKAAGLSYKAHSAAIEESIQKTSRLAALDDEDLTDAFTNIVRVTGDVDKSLRLTGLAADFARAKQMDVAKAGEIVGKVAGGNTGILSRYGLQIEKGASASEALALLQGKFAGQAKAYGNTVAGSQDRVRVASENLGEAVGKGLTPYIAKASEKIADLLGWLEKHPGTAKAAAIATVTLTTAIAGVLVAAKVATAVQVLRKAVLAMNLAFLANPIVLVTAAIVAVGAAMVVAYRKSETFRNVVNGVFRAVSKAAGDFGAVFLRVVDKWLGGISSVLTAASHIPIVGSKFKNAAKGVDEARESLRGVASKLDEIGEKPVRNVKVNVRYKVVGPDGKNLGDTKADYPGGDGLGFAGVLRRGAQQAANASAPRMPSLPTSGGGSLMGANARLGPFAALGARFGLHVSSGLRPGSITSSGNVSHHAAGNAIDLAGGAGGMMRAFKTLKSNFGSRLAELIYTPGGIGIKDGRPFRYTGKVAADHYDHVHVAYTGAGTGAGGRRRTGDGKGRSDTGGDFRLSDLRMLAERAGFNKAQATVMAAIGAAESSGHANASHRNSDGTTDTGLWQINSIHGFKGNLKNPLVNAKAARSVFKKQGFGAWVVYKTGAYKRFLNAAKKAKPHAGAKGPKVGGIKRAGGVGFVDDPDRFERLEYDAQVARENAPAVAGVDVGGDVGTGETADPNQPLIDALAANTAAEQARAEAEAATRQEIARMTDEMRRANNAADQVNAVSLRSAWQSMAALISGEIVGGYEPRAMSVGAGAVARY